MERLHFLRNLFHREGQAAGKRKTHTTTNPPPFSKKAMQWLSWGGLHPVLPFLDFSVFIKENPQIYQEISLSVEPLKTLENLGKTP